MVKMAFKKPGILALFLYTSILSIIIPFLILPVWSFSSRWVWPKLWPEGFSLRGVEELFSPISQVPAVLLGSIGLSFFVAVLAAIIGLMTARALVFMILGVKRLFFLVLTCRLLFRVQLLPWEYMLSLSI